VSGTGTHLRGFAQKPTHQDCKRWRGVGNMWARDLKTHCIAFQYKLCEQVFSPKPWKKFWCRFVLSFREKRNFNSEKWRHRAEG